jgi:hypothetical protein
MGGVLGIAVLASVFSATGSYANGQAFVRGLVPAVAAGAAIVGLAVVAALAIPRRGRRLPEPSTSQLEIVPADPASDEMLGTLVTLG